MVVCRCWSSSSHNVCISQSEIMSVLSTNYGYCFKQPFKHIVRTSESASCFVNRIVRHSDHCIHKFWLCFRTYDYVLGAAIVNLSTTLRPHLNQTPTKLRHINVEAWFDQTSTTLRSNSDCNFINYDHFPEIMTIWLKGCFTH